MEEGNAIRQAVEAKFVSSHTFNFLWQRLKDDISIGMSQPYRWISEYITGKAVIMFFDKGKESSVFFFEDGANAGSILEDEDCLRADQDFYLTDRSIEFVICFDHHDYLIACGNAKTWLEQKLNRDTDAAAP